MKGEKEGGKKGGKKEGRKKGLDQSFVLQHLIEYSGLYKRGLLESLRG